MPQVSELFRRGVVRPVDARARDQLSQFYVTTSIRCEWLPILGEDAFVALWVSGLFKALGEACDMAFGDYEEIMVESDDVPKASGAVALYLTQAPVVGAPCVADGHWPSID